MTVAPRLVRVRCATWDQVEAFYRRKLRAGGRLSMKAGFAGAVGAPVTLVLELPNQIALSIDGEVSATAVDGKAVEVTLQGLSAGLLGRLESLVADARAGTLEPEPQDEESRLLSARREQLLRMRRLPAHEVLGVPREPTPYELRSAWLALAGREHPDAVARYASPALSAVAADSMSLVGAAYDRVRAALVAEGRGIATGSSLRPVPARLHDDDPIATGFFADAVTPPVAAAVELRQRTTAPIMAVAAPVEISREPSTPIAVASSARTSQIMNTIGDDPPIPRVGAGDRFVRQVRQHVVAGDHVSAGHVAEAALQLYPDDRRLRGLAAVAAAMAAAARGDRAGAVTALETATAADPGCGEASTALAELRHAALPTAAMIQRWFA